MPREIKFRCWVKDTHEMLYQTNIETYHDQDLRRMVTILSYDDDPDQGDYVTGETVLMQFTGLKDKNGKEIFENDVVEYRDCCGRIKRKICEWIDDEGGFPLFGADYGCGDNVGSDYEVIGNIYENSDLLKN